MTLFHSSIFKFIFTFFSTLAIFENYCVIFKSRIDNRNFDDIINYEKAGKAGPLSVPTPDHFIPLLYSIALAEPNEKIEHTYEEVSFGGMSMRTLKIG